MLRQWFVAALVMGATSSCVEAACVDPSTLVHSTASISRYFDEGEQKTGVLGIRGTAWFLSPASMVTAEHVATAMRLSDEEWKQVEILEGANKRSISVRIQRLAGSHAEKIAVLELLAAYPTAQSLQMRIEPLVAEEQIVSLAYPGSRLRFAAGRFVKYGDSDRVTGAALLEMYDGDDRTRARSWCLRRTSAGLRWPCCCGCQQSVHANTAVSLPCDTDLDRMGNPQRRFRAYSGAGGICPR